MSKFNFEVNLIGLDKMKTLVLMLNEKIESLPTELQLSIEQLLSEDVFEYDSTWFNNTYGSKPIKVIADDVEIQDVAISINPYTKTVKCNVIDVNGNPTIKNDNLILDELKPSKLSVYAGDDLVLEW